MPKLVVFKEIHITVIYLLYVFQLSQLLFSLHSLKPPLARPNDAVSPYSVAAEVASLPNLGVPILQ